MCASLRRSCYSLSELAARARTYWRRLHCRLVSPNLGPTARSSENTGSASVRPPFVGPNRLRKLIDHFGDVERAWTAEPGELQAVLDDRSAESLQRTRRTLSLDREMERIDRAGIQ